MYGLNPVRKKEKLFIQQVPDFQKKIILFTKNEKNKKKIVHP